MNLTDWQTELLHLVGLLTERQRLLLLDFLRSLVDGLGARRG